MYIRARETQTLKIDRTGHFRELGRDSSLAKYVLNFKQIQCTSYFMRKEKKWLKGMYDFH